MHNETRQNFTKAVNTLTTISSQFPLCKGQQTVHVNVDQAMKYSIHVSFKGNYHCSTSISSD